MATQTSMSFIVSLLSSILVFALLQFCKRYFASSQFLTLAAGFAGSWFFILLLTAISNFESIVFGKGFQARWFPEVITCLFVACFACSTIHRVAVTTCFLFSCIALYYLNIISQKFHAAPVAVDVSLSKKKKK
ncbi:hypothetical protein PVAND_013212 [Polypedilum vanderplanki]|uniref:Dolichyl-diphosphooligosaccharide--protein glycosyltransferase subunit KCP2 n=1 Tax=Polypedilum vanderplanki TaxID=319348 RepID=A0A9J6CPP4_POLVA|nr:hypothetical protein PVAND_013212 [Polypedilum vanderplanki]